MEKQNEMEIDLRDLLFFLRKKIWLIVAAFMVFALLGAGFTAFFAQDEYTAKTRMYVLNRTQEAPAVSSDYNVSNYMIEDYKVLITGENVSKEVIKVLELKMTTAELAKKISVEAINDTRVLQIKVVDSDPERAAAIANTVREVAGQQLKEIMDLEAVNLVYEAQVPDQKSGHNLTGNTVVAAVIGLAIALVALVVIYLLDDTIRSEEDVERRMGLSVLGVIPLSSELEAMANNTTAAAVPEKKKSSVLAKFKK